MATRGRLKDERWREAIPEELNMFSIPPGEISVLEWASAVFSAISMELVLIHLFLVMAIPYLLIGIRRHRNDHTMRELLLHLLPFYRSPKRQIIKVQMARCVGLLMVVGYLWIPFSLICLSFYEHIIR